MTQASARAGMTTTDGDIVQGLTTGDLKAFESLMRRHNRALYRTARAILKDDAEAEDALQEAYLLAYRGIANFRGESSLSTWLTRIVVNEALARLRKATRRAQVIELGTAGLPDAGTDEEQLDHADMERPEQAMMRTETRQLIEKKIDALPDAFRTVFVMRALEEMSVEETAACLGIPEATVRTRYFRARALLREMLAREIDLATGDAFSFDGERCDRIVAGTLARLSCTEKDGKE